RRRDGAPGILPHGVVRSACCPSWRSHKRSMVRLRYRSNGLSERISLDHFNLSILIAFASGESCLETPPWEVAVEIATRWSGCGDRPALFIIDNEKRTGREVLAVSGFIAAAMGRPSNA